MSATASDRTPLRLRFFFVVMASAVILTVFAGFAPTFYLRGSSAQTRPMSVLLHVHGVVFSAWVSFFLVQTLLMARGSRRLHQRLGWIGAPDWHKRLMLSATIVLLGAPMFRCVIHLIGRSDMAKVSIVSTLLVDAFFLPCFAYDLLTRRRIHPAYLVALVLIVLDQVAQATVVSWTPWINFSQALQRMVA